MPPSGMAVAGEWGEAAQADEKSVVGESQQAGSPRTEIHGNPSCSEEPPGHRSSRSRSRSRGQPSQACRAQLQSSQACTPTPRRSSELRGPSRRLSQGQTVVVSRTECCGPLIEIKVVKRVFTMHWRQFLGAKHVSKVPGGRKVAN